MLALLTWLLLLGSLTALTGLTLAALALTAATLVSLIRATLTWCGFSLPLSPPGWAWFWGL